MTTYQHDRQPYMLNLVVVSVTLVKWLLRNVRSPGSPQMVALLKSLFGYSEKAEVTLPETPAYRVGEYYADYTPLTKAEIEQIDPAVDELFKRSRPISG